MIQAFLLAFTAADKVVLYLRCGRDKTQPQRGIDKIVRAMALSHPAKIVWVPPQPSESYRDMYASADAFVLPTHAEGFGRPIMEAMAMGLPTIATAW